jgi:hypothetical protein
MIIPREEVTRGQQGGGENPDGDAVPYRPKDALYDMRPEMIKVANQDPKERSVNSCMHRSHHTGNLNQRSRGQPNSENSGCGAGNREKEEDQRNTLEGVHPGEELVRTNSASPM